MDQDLVKQALMEVLDQGGKKGRKWFFPKNVDNQYKVIANMTVKELFVYIVPAFLISLGIGSIPPYDSIVFWLIKAVFIVFIILTPVIFINYRPVKLRDNIRTKDFIREFFDYQKKKKIYFVAPKKRDHLEG